MSRKGSIKENQQFAYQELEKDDGKMFDPKILEKCLRCLKNIV